MTTCDCHDVTYCAICDKTRLFSFAGVLTAVVAGVPGIGPSRCVSQRLDGHAYGYK